MSDREPDVALALGGGGARAAYQVGVLYALGRHVPDLRFPILTGVSAGAINTVFLANYQGSFGEATERLLAFWKDLRPKNVFRTTPRSLVANALRAVVQAVAGVSPGSEPLDAMVDTEPLRRLLRRRLEAADGRLRGVDANIESGRLDAVAVSAMLYATGQTVTFCAGRDVDPWERPEGIARQVEFSVEHILASLALPLFFPAVRIGDEWFGDGGMRLVAPLSPALHLGAERIVAISTCYRPPEGEASRPAFEGPPAPAQVIGALYDAIFPDFLDQHVLHVERINDLVRDVPASQEHGFRDVGIVVIRPSEDLGAIAREHERELPWTVRYLTRALGSRRSGSGALLSNILFAPRYLRTLFDLGERDGALHAEAVADLIEPRGSSRGVVARRPVPRV
jgi:NTE family protein